MKALELLSDDLSFRSRLLENTAWFRSMITSLGYDILPGDTAIIPVMLYDEPLAVKLADELLKEGIYVIGFTYPVVPRGKARIRIQISASHTREDLEQAVKAFRTAGIRLGIISSQDER